VKPKDVGRCPLLEHAIEFSPMNFPRPVGYHCTSTKHPSQWDTYDTPCTLADYKDCEYREEK